MGLCPKCPRYIFRHIHALSALIVQTQNRRHHVAAGTGFQGWSAFLRITDTSGFRPSAGTEPGCKHQSGRISSSATVSTGHSRCFSLWREDLCLLGVPGCKTSGHNAGVSLAGLPPACTESSMLFVGQKAISISLGYNSLSNESLLFHPRLRTERTRNIMQIPHLVPLVGGKRNGMLLLHCVRKKQPRLNSESGLQLRRKRFPTFFRPSQNSQASCRR